MFANLSSCLIQFACEGFTCKDNAVGSLTFSLHAIPPGLESVIHVIPVNMSIPVPLSHAHNIPPLNIQLEPSAMTLLVPMLDWTNGCLGRLHCV